MDESLSGEDSDNIDWDTEDELEIQDTPFSSCTDLRTTGQHVISGDGEASSSSVPHQFIQQFVMMGFPEESIAKAIQQNGENEDLVLDALLAFKAPEDSPEEQPYTSPQLDPSNGSDDSSFEYNENLLDDVYVEDNWSSDSDNCINSAKRCYLNDGSSSSSEKEQTLKNLATMGYSVEEASIAMERCGPEATLDVLIDFISTAQMSRAEDAYLPEDVKPKLKRISNDSGGYKRKMYNELCKTKKHRAILDEGTIRFPKHMIGFGVPTVSLPTIVQRKLSKQAVGPPFFYYENVAQAPKDVWNTISRHLFDVLPEFVDSIYFCAAARKRGYIHNLPVEKRFPLCPLPPSTIHEALPLTKKWWPSWDKRTKLNCLLTAIGSAKLTDRIRKVLEKYDGEPSMEVQKYVLAECKKWNLVWVGRNKVAPLEPDEVEMLLGFPENHTRGISRTDRYKSLGNSFQVDTVAYHLSVLKDKFPTGINVLSLFSGIGGAEVALDRLGIHMKNVVSVEKSAVNRVILRSWWDQTDQEGKLEEFEDVKELTRDCLEKLMDSFGEFDLVIGGSPCNNLAGGNRVSRDGLEGTESSLFFDYVRILNLVKSIMSSRRI